MLKVLKINALCRQKKFSFSNGLFMLLATMAVASRNILNVEIVPAANAALNRACKETGMSKKDVIARMLAWYSAQVQEVQSVVMGHTPASLIPAAQEIALLQIRENPFAAKKNVPDRFDVAVGNPLNQTKETDALPPKPRK